MKIVLIVILEVGRKRYYCFCYNYFDYPQYCCFYRKAGRGGWMKNIVKCMTVLLDTRAAADNITMEINTDIVG